MGPHDGGFGVVTLECALCHRMGRRLFVPYGSEGWVCSRDDLCRARRRRREQGAFDHLDTVPQPPAPRIDGDGVDQSWQDVPYVVIPPHTATPLAHLALVAHGYLWVRGSGSSAHVVNVRTRCGRDMIADRSNDSWSRLCRGCFPQFATTDTGSPS